MDINLLKQRLIERSRRFGPALLVAVAAGTIGYYGTQASNASTYVIAPEAESGTAAGVAGAGDTAGASGDASIKFGIVTPAPTPPPTPPPSGGSCALPAFPDAGCTGVPAGVTLTDYTGPDAPAAGAVIDGKRITQCLDIKQPGVIIRNSRLTGDCSWSVDSWITSTEQSAWTQIIDSEIICDGMGNGIGERGFIARRVEISGCENGMDVDQDALIEDSYIHSLDEGPTGDGHGDGIQSALLINITIRHNTIIGRTGDLTNPGNNATSAIITPPNGTRDALIEHNFLAGGAATIYCPENAPDNVRVQNNTFAHRPGPLGAAFFYADGCTSGTIWSGNVTDAGQSVDAGS